MRNAFLLFVAHFDFERIGIGEGMQAAVVGNAECASVAIGGEDS